MKPSNASHGKFCPAMKKLREVEKLYIAKEKHYVRLRRNSEDKGEEFTKVKKELNELGERLESSEQEFWAKLDENGSWVARLVRYWWRSWRRRRF
jgi:hypothetical protein